MREYELILNVPDNFDPEEMSVNVDYKENISIKAEGFTSRYDEFLAKARDILKDNQVSFENLVTKDGDVVIFKFPKDAAENMDPMDFQSYLTIVRDSVQQYTGCTTLGFMNDLDFMVQNADESVAMLEGMIQKIKTRAAILRK